LTVQTVLQKSKLHTVHEKRTTMTANSKVITAVTPTYTVNKTQISMPTVCMP